MKNYERRIEVTVPMTWCQRVSKCQPVGTRDANQSCEGVISGTLTAELFMRCFDRQMERLAGCSLKDTPRLFTPFCTTKPQGTGMELAICRSILEGHGGKLWARADEERGETFQFMLPTGGERIVRVD